MSPAWPSGSGGSIRPRPSGRTDKAWPSKEPPGPVPGSRGRTQAGRKGQEFQFPRIHLPSKKQVTTESYLNLK